MRYIPWSRYNEENNLIPRVYRKRHLPAVEPVNATMEENVEDLEDDEIFDEEPETAPASWTLKFDLDELYAGAETGHRMIHDMLVMYHTVCGRSECTLSQEIIINPEHDMFEYRLWVNISPRKKADLFLKKKNGIFIGLFSFRFKPKIDPEEDHTILISSITDARRQYQCGYDGQRVDPSEIDALPGTSVISLSTRVTCIDVNGLKQGKIKDMLDDFVYSGPSKFSLCSHNAELLTGGGTSGS